MSTILNNTRGLQEVLEALQNKTAGPMVDPATILPRTKQGNHLLCLTDVSEVPHDVTVKITSDTVNDFSGMKLKVFKNNLANSLDNPFWMNYGYTNTISNMIVRTTETGFKFDVLNACKGSWNRAGLQLCAIEPYKGKELFYSHVLSSAITNLSKDRPWTVILSAGDNELSETTDSYTAVGNNFTNSKNYREANFGVSTLGLYSTTITIAADETRKNLFNCCYVGTEQDLEPGDFTEYSDIALFPVEDVLEYDIPSDGILTIPSRTHNMGFYVQNKDVNIQVQYNKSYGMQLAYDTFWDTRKQSNESRHCQFAGWPASQINPKYDLTAPTLWGMFFQCKLPGKLSEWLTKWNVKLDTNEISKSEGLYYTFYYSAFNEIDIDLNASACANLTNTFSYMKRLTKIQKIILNDEGTTSFSNTFINCQSLRDIEFEGVIGKSLSFSNSGQLTHASIMNIIEHLRDLVADGITTKTTLTLGSTNLAKLTDEEKAIATQKGWTLA